MSIIGPAHLSLCTRCHALWRCVAGSRFYTTHSSTISTSILILRIITSGHMSSVISRVERSTLHVCFRSVHSTSVNPVKKCPYTVLGVSRDAAPKDIKAAYYDLSKEHHPDVNQEDPNASHRFSEITDAYDILSSPLKRREYDASTRATNDLHSRASRAQRDNHRHTGSMDYSDFKNYQRFRSKWRRQAQPRSDQNFKEYDYEAHFRNHYGPRNTSREHEEWSEEQTRQPGGDGDKYTSRRVAWLRMQEHVRVQKANRNQLGILLVFVVAGAFAAVVTELMVSEKKRQMQLNKHQNAQDEFWNKRDISKPFTNNLTKKE